MSPVPELATRFEAYGEWRSRLSDQIRVLCEWLEEQELAPAGLEARQRTLLLRLAQDRLLVAFVAEFSRGKSELINAIFFADFGQRLLPSTAGRTTMCPSEILYDPKEPPSIRLLPIETRLVEASVAELRERPDEWVTLPLDLDSAASMSEALARVSAVKEVPVRVAREYGLHDGADTRKATEAMVEIPAWRHAIINFPHPLLRQGLVILDTPGLNAVGTEPELTLSQIPSAHAVVFVLSADAGVTKTDYEMWTQHLGGGDEATRSRRLVVLNKIDGLWDELKRPEEIDAAIARQIRDSAALLGIDESQVLGVSAQKALVAKINGDDSLLGRSRLPALEAALSERLIPAKRDIVGAAVRADLRDLTAAVRATLDARQAGVGQQLAELRALRGRNTDVIAHMLGRVRAEKDRFERGLQRFTAMRSVLTEETNRLFEFIGMEALRSNAARTRDRIEASTFTRGIRSAMRDFFAGIRDDFDKAGRKAGELHELAASMHEKFAGEYGFEPIRPPLFPMQKYRAEIDRLEQVYDTHFNTLWNMVSRAKFALMRRFFETIASRVKHVYRLANRDLETWLNAVTTPFETQIREHHTQLRHRVESIRRVQTAGGALEEKLAELGASDEAITRQQAALERALARIDGLIDAPQAERITASA